MVDNENYDDEYQFIDPEAAGSSDTMAYSPESTTPTSGEKSFIDKTFAGKSGVIRNVLIVVGLTVLVMVIYPFVQSSGSIKQKPAEISPVIQESKAKPYVAPTVTPAPVIAPVAEKVVDEKVTQQLTTLASNQDRMQSEFVATNNQLNGISNSINDMMVKVTELNRITALYASKIEEQARQIEQLTAQAQAKEKARVAHSARPKMTSPQLNYYIQAVIPGRAWLTATNGSTLTVREGTVIAGLGRVTLIDPRQGRVVISSGRVIRFSQEDS